MCGSHSIVKIDSEGLVGTLRFSENPVLGSFLLGAIILSFLRNLSSIVLLLKMLVMVSSSNYWVIRCFFQVVYLKFARNVRFLF